MAGMPSGPLRSILCDRREPVLALKHGIRIPIDPAIVKVVATWREEDIESDEFRRGDDEHPGDASPFPIEAYYPGGSGSITPHCYLLRVSYPCEFYVLATYDSISTTWDDGDSSGGWWREDVVISQDEAVQLCSDFGAEVLDQRLQAAVEAHEEREWATLARQCGDVCELIEDPDGLAIVFQGKTAKFERDEQVAFRFACFMLRTLINDLETQRPVARLRAELRSRSQGQRWAYNLCILANRRIAPLELGYHLSCPLRSEFVTWERPANELPVLKAA